MSILDRFQGKSMRIDSPEYKAWCKAASDEAWLEETSAEHEAWREMTANEVPMTQQVRSDSEGILRQQLKDKQDLLHGFTFIRELSAEEQADLPDEGWDNPKVNIRTHYVSFVQSWSVDEETYEDGKRAGRLCQVVNGLNILTDG